MVSFVLSREKMASGQVKVKMGVKRFGLEKGINYRKPDLSKLGGAKKWLENSGIASLLHTSKIYTELIISSCEGKKQDFLFLLVTFMKITFFYSE